MNVIVTGASKGIGRAVAEVFAKEGATLFLCARNEDQLNAAVSSIRRQYPQSTIHGRPHDLSRKEEAVAFGNWCLEQGPPDILVNNAGSYLPGSLYNEPEGQLEQMIAVNLYSAYHLTRVLVPAMIKAGGGHIFNMCSIASLHAYDNGGSYSVSKFALSGFSKNLREELKGYGIKVTGVYPGAVMTDSWGNFDNSGKRIMEAEDVAGMIFTASRLSHQAVVEDIVLRPQLGDL